MMMLCIAVHVFNSHNTCTVHVLILCFLKYMHLLHCICIYTYFLCYAYVYISFTFSLCVCLSLSFCLCLFSLSPPSLFLSPLVILMYIWRHMLEIILHPFSLPYISLSHYTSSLMWLVFQFL